LQNVEQIGNFIFAIHLLTKLVTVTITFVMSKLSSSPPSVPAGVWSSLFDYLVSTVGSNLCRQLWQASYAL